MELREVLRWVVSGGGAGLLAYWIMSKIQWPPDFKSEVKRYITIALTFVLADGLFLLSVLFGYDAMPVGAVAIIEQLWLVGTTAFGLSQIIHGAVDLRTRDSAI